MLRTVVTIVAAVATLGGLGLSAGQHFNSSPSTAARFNPPTIHGSAPQAAGAQAAQPTAPAGPTAVPSVARSDWWDCCGHFEGPGAGAPAPTVTAGPPPAATPFPHDTWQGCCGGHGNVAPGGSPGDQRGGGYGRGMMGGGHMMGRR